MSLPLCRSLPFALYIAAFLPFSFPLHISPSLPFPIFQSFTLPSSLSPFISLFLFHEHSLNFPLSIPLSTMQLHLTQNALSVWIMVTELTYTQWHSTAIWEHVHPFRETLGTPITNYKSTPIYHFYSLHLKIIDWF